jgi:hypothetical protein
MIHRLCCDNTCHANGNNSEAYTVIIFFNKFLFWPPPFLVATFLWIGFNQSAISCTPVKRRIGEHTRKLAKLFKIYSNLSYLNKKFQNLQLAATHHHKWQVTNATEGKTFFPGAYSSKGFQIWKSQNHYASPVRSTLSSSRISMGKDTVPNSIQSTWHIKWQQWLCILSHCWQGPHVLDRQFLQLTSSSSKTKSLNNDCAGTLQLNRRDITQTVKEKKPEKGKLIALQSSPVPIPKSWSGVTKKT